MSRRMSLSGKMRGEVFRCVLRRGALGATIEEIAALTGIRVQTVCARRNELGNKGLIVDGGSRRETMSGSSAKVWVVPEAIANAARLRGMAE